MRTISQSSPSPTPGLVLVADPTPWYATTPISEDDRRRDLEDEHSDRAALSSTTPTLKARR